MGERPTRRQWLGAGLALGGLGLIALTVGGDVPPAGFLLTLVSPVSFGVGNVLIAWLSLVPPLPALALSMVLDGPTALPAAVLHASWPGLAAALFLGVVATTVAYAIWGTLFRRYPAALVTPFALLVPFVGAAASALAFGERFGPLRLSGMTLVLAGLAVILAPTAGRAVAPPRQ